MTQDMLTTLGLIVAAELGDKSQFVCLALASRFAPASVLAGAVLAFALLNALAVTAGSLVGTAIPLDVVQVSAAVAFAAFGLHTLLSDADEEETVEPTPSGHPILTSAAWIGLAELGDKTQLSVAALATVQDATATWLGATLALALTSALAIGLGHWLLPRLPTRLLRVVSGTLFLLVSAWLFASWAS
ncbi:MAG: TMEM165/GDT1 family protein [Proteobacteria bacterium]|nr:TMEM165/GDT1 family protein [Pseudomonadota bacterium]